MLRGDRHHCDAPWISLRAQKELYIEIVQKFVHKNFFVLRKEKFLRDIYFFFTSIAIIIIIIIIILLWQIYGTHLI